MKSSATFNDNDSFRSMSQYPESPSPSSSLESSPLKEYPSHADRFIHSLSNPNYFDFDLDAAPVKRGGEVATYAALVTLSHHSGQSSKSHLSLSNHTKDSSWLQGHAVDFSPALLPGATAGPGTLKSLEDTPAPIPVGREDPWFHTKGLSAMPRDPSPRQQKTTTMVSSVTTISDIPVQSGARQEVTLLPPRTQPQRCTMETWSQPSEAIYRLRATFMTHDADVQYDEMKHKFEGIVYPRGVPLFFTTALYMGDRGTTLIEFKRQDGATLAFCQFYASVRKQLEPTLNHWCYGSEPKPRSSLSPPSSMSRFEPEYRRAMKQVAESVEKISDGTFDTLFEMVSSDDPLVQKKGILGLAMYASSKQHALALWEYSDRRYKKEGGEYPPLVRVFQRFLSQTELDGIVLRSIATLLKHCVMHPENMDCESAESTCLGCQAVKCNLCEPLFGLLEAPVSVAMKDVQRQLACALANLTLKHASCILQSSKAELYISTLERICHDSGRCTVVVEQLRLALDRCDSTTTK